MASPSFTSNAACSACEPLLGSVRRFTCSRRRLWQLASATTGPLRHRTSVLLTKLKLPLLLLLLLHSPLQGPTQVLRGREWRKLLPRLRRSYVLLEEQFCDSLRGLSKCRLVMRMFRKKATICPVKQEADDACRSSGAAGASSPSPAGESEGACSRAEPGNCNQMHREFQLCYLGSVSSFALQKISVLWAKDA